MARSDPLLAYLEKPTRRRLARAVRSYYRTVWEAAYRAGGNHEDAADICQDVFPKLLLEPPEAADVRSPAGYLATRVLARASALRRSADRQRARELARERPAAAESPIGGDLEVLRRHVEKLPEDLRRPIELRFLAGRPILEVARATVSSASPRGTTR